MSDLQDTLDAIAQLVIPRCGHCSASLSTDSGALDYCGPDCQAAWIAAKAQVGELAGYREPRELMLPGVDRDDLEVLEQVAARDAVRRVGIRAWDEMLLAGEKPAQVSRVFTEVIEKGEQT